MKIGFTGTQRGLTPKQRATLVKWLDTHGVTEAHHGDCVGADAEFDELLEERAIATVIHPPAIDMKRAWRFRLWALRLKFSEALDGPRIKRKAVELPPRPYLVRNRAIVGATAALISCPGEMVAKLRSGTWMTTRYAVKLRRPVRVFWPDGTTTREGLR